MMKPKVQIELTRDSVCMGDDVGDHAMSINIVPSLLGDKQLAFRVSFSYILAKGISEGRRCE